MAYKFNPLLGAGLDDAGSSISALNVLGTVANEAALPGSATAGDVYQAEDTGVFYAWDGTGWDNLGTLAGPQGPTGATGPAGADGVGVIAGGTTGQALVKASNTDYDTQWADVTAVAALDDLTDVNLTSPSDGQVLEYDSATSTWVNAAPSGGGGTPGGSDTQVQFNDGGSFGGDSGLTFNKTTNALTVGASTGDGGSAKVYGDINLDDGGTYATTLQMVTPTANRVISFPDATGTVGLVAGSSGQVTYNNAGAQAGDSGLLYDATSGALTVGGKTVTANAPVLNLSQTWNNAGVTFTGLKFTVTDSASATGSALLDFIVGTTRRFYVSKGGLIKAPSLPTYADNAAATSGGLVAGDVYKTATGDLRITV